MFNDLTHSLFNFLHCRRQCLQATASVDLATDTAVQKTIRCAFAKSTIVTIAHRLNTVAFYDRVLVLSQGEAVEFDAPLALLERPAGAFRKLAEGTGDLQGLVRIAKEASRR